MCIRDRPEPEDLTLSAICDAAVRLASPPSKIEELNTDIMCGVVVEGVWRNPSAVVRGAWSVGSATHPRRYIFVTRRGFGGSRRIYAASAHIGREEAEIGDATWMDSRRGVSANENEPDPSGSGKNRRFEPAEDAGWAERMSHPLFPTPREKNRETLDSPRVAIDAARRADRMGCTER